MIRKATKDDSRIVSRLMFGAMEDIVYKMIGERNSDKGIDFLRYLFEREGNQYSYTNAVVFEGDGKVLGSLIYYDGAKLNELRQRVLESARELSGCDVFMEDETSSCELYLDTLSVLEPYRGRGIGRKLLEYAKTDFPSWGKDYLALLVDVENPNAQRLYERVGFRVKDEIDLAGGRYRRMVISKEEV